MIKNDSNEDYRIKFNKTFYLELKEVMRQVVCDYLRGNVGRDILNSATAVGNRLSFLS